MSKQITDTQTAEEKTRTTINMAAIKPVIKSSKKSHLAQSMHGLFGDVPFETKQKNTKKSKVITFGPKSLEGIFIQDGQAWAIVTDQKNKAQLIPPENISAFTATSITFKSKQGIKSLHIKQNDLGIDIRRSRGKEKRQGNDTAVKTISRAEKIRQAMLKKHKKNLPP